MDDTVGAFNINRVVRERSEGLFSDDSVVDEVLTDGVSVVQWTGHGGKVGGRNIGGGDLSRNDVHLDGVGIDGVSEGFVSFQSTVNRGEDGVRTGSGKFGGNTGGLKGFVEFSEVIVSLKVGFFLANSDTISTPDLTRSFEGGQSVNNGSTGTGGGGNRGSGSRGGSSYMDRRRVQNTDIGK